MSTRARAGPSSAQNLLWLPHHFMSLPREIFPDHTLEAPPWQVSAFYLIPFLEHETPGQGLYAESAQWMLNDRTRLVTSAQWALTSAPC